MPHRAHTTPPPLSQVEGITLPIMEQALRQAAEGRRHILQQMEACAPAPRGELGPYTPRIAQLSVRPMRIWCIVYGDAASACMAITELELCLAWSSRK